MFSCNVKSNSEEAVAYLGGEIINPKNRDVVLFRFEDKASDTFRLDNNNRFIHRFDNFKAGIYEIWHGNEYQIVVLEPNDSIMFRVNTYDFDESLVFTGKGSKKNNYLIKTFLSYETERRKLMKYSQMNPEEFHSFC